jgi:hypothetical protein
LHQLHGSLLDEMRGVHQKLHSKLVPMHMCSYHQVHADGPSLPSLRSLHRRDSQMLHCNSRSFFRLLSNDHQVLGLSAEGLSSLHGELLRSIVEMYEAVHRFSVAMQHEVSPSHCVLSVFHLQQILQSKVWLRVHVWKAFKKEFQDLRGASGGDNRGRDCDSLLRWRCTWLCVHFPS